MHRSWSGEGEEGRMWGWRDRGSKVGLWWRGVRGWRWWSELWRGGCWSWFGLAAAVMLALGILPECFWLGGCSAAVNSRWRRKGKISGFDPNRLTGVDWISCDPIWRYELGCWSWLETESNEPLLLVAVVVGASCRNVKTSEPKLSSQKSSFLLSLRQLN